MSLRMALSVVLCGMLLPVVSFAQELIITSNATTEIDDAEAYRAYYGTLTGESHVYTMRSDEPFRLSIVVLTPNVEGARTDFTATVIDRNNPTEPVIVLDGAVSEWQWFFDTAGRDEYLAGPVLRGGLTQGEYEVRITNADNQGQYVLVLGEDSWFSLQGVFSRYVALPVIKETFFGKPAYQAYLTPLLIWPAIAILSVVTIAVFATYIIRKRREPLQISL